MTLYSFNRFIKRLEPMDSNQKILFSFLFSLSLSPSPPYHPPSLVLILSDSCSLTLFFFLWLYPSLLDKITYCNEFFQQWVSSWWSEYLDSSLLFLAFQDSAKTEAESPPT